MTFDPTAGLAAAIAQSVANYSYCPITAAECYDLAGKSWMPAAASEALIRAARTIEALEPTLREIDWQEVYAASAHAREQIEVLIRRAVAAETRIATHNEGCRQACSARGTCNDYTARGRMCPDCPQDWMIDGSES